MTALRILAVEVNAILRDYVRIHNDIFGFSLRKILPIPGLFRPIEYCSHQDTLRNLSERLAVIVTRDLAELTPETVAETTFLPVFTTYSRALQDTMQRLFEICIHLCRKSQGDPGYRYVTYDADVTAYETAVKNYVALGNRLNELYAAVRGAA